MLLKTSTCAPASSQVSLMAPSAEDSAISMYPAGTVHSPLHGWIARLHSRILPSCSMMHPTTCQAYSNHIMQHLLIVDWLGNVNAGRIEPLSQLFLIKE